MSSSRKNRARQSKHPNSKKTKHNKPITTRGRATYQRALALLSDLRRGVDSYSGLLRKYRLRGRTARKYLGRDLIGGTRGKRVRASKSDRRVRDVWFPTSVGDIRFRTRSSQDATTLSDFFYDRKQLLYDKLDAHQFERKWRGVHVAGKELFVDAEVIFRMADAGELKIEDLYASTGGAL